MKDPGSPATPTTRFAFFGGPPVPMLYAAATEESAISETILHDVPVGGGRITADPLLSNVLSTLVTTRALTMLCLHGHGFRRLDIDPDQVTRTSPRRCPPTVPWAEAAHTAGFDGIEWMSRHHDTSQAYVLFGSPDRPDRHADVTIHPDPERARAFAVPRHLDWLTRILAPLQVSSTT